MNKKSLLLTLVLFSILVLSPAYSAISLFEETIGPCDKSLREDFKNFKVVDKKIEGIIAELRSKVKDPKASFGVKVDLAAFLLKKVILQNKEPYADNELVLLEIAELIPDDFYLESIWGDLLYTKGDYEECIKHYEMALNKQPNHVNVTGKCAIANYYTLHYEKAVEYAEVYLEQNPKEFGFLFMTASAKYELGEYDDAIDYGESALEVCPDDNNRNKVEELIRKAKEAAASTSDSSRDEDQKFVITFAGNSREDLGDFAFSTLNEVYYDVTSLLNCDPDVKINVVFFLTEDYYNQNKGWSAASALGLQVRVPLVTGYKSEEYVKGVLAHEFTHTIINYKANNYRVPIWVHEGLAQYQQFRTEFGSEENLRPDYVSIYENDFKENDLYIPLEKIPAYMGSKDRKDISRAYIASWLAIRCMGDLYSESSFDTLLTSIGKGNDIRQAVEDATGESYDDFQDELKQWIKNQ